MGFQEISAENVRENIALEGEFLTSAINGRSLRCGRLEIPTLQELRERIPLSDFAGKIQLEEVVGDAMALHKDIANENAVFQAASQFNLAEMVGPGSRRKPELTATKTIRLRGLPAPLPVARERFTGTTSCR